MAAITITLTDAFLPEIWSTDALDNFVNSVVAQPHTDRRWEKLLRPGGDRVNVPDVDSFTANTLTNMTGTITFTAPADAEDVTTIIVDTLVYFAFKVDDAARIQNTLPLFEAYSEKAGQAVAIKVDTDILAALDGTSNTVGTDNIALSDDTILSAIETLDINNNPLADRVMFVSPKMLMDMWKVDRYMNSLYSATSGNLPTGKGRGYVGHVYNDIYETTNLPSGAAGKKGFLFQKTGIAHIMQSELKAERRIPHDELTEAVILWGMYGNKLMRAASVIEIDGR